MATGEFYELFTGADGTEIDSRNSDSGHSWTETTVYGTNNNAGKITSNKLKCANSSGALYYSSWSPASADYGLVADYTYNGSTALDGIDLYLRKTADNTFTAYRFRVYYDTVNSQLAFIIQGVSSGSQANFSSASTGTLESGYLVNRIAAPANGTTYTLTFVCSGNTITAYRNGTKILEGTGTGPTATGKAGVAVYGTTGSAAPTLDNLRSVVSTQSYTVDAVVGNPPVEVSYTADGLVIGSRPYTADAVALEAIPDGFAAGYTYRMSAPVANPSTLGDRTFTMRFPGAFLLAQGKITSGSFNDIRVVDATTGIALPHSYSSNVLTVDYPGMPAGRRTLYVYYGKSGAAAPVAPYLSAAATVQVIDPNGEVTSAGSTTPTDYIWGSDLECTYLDSGATTTYYGAGTSHKLGVTSASRKYHMLVKPGEWCLRKATTGTAKLHLYVETNNVGSGETLTIYTHKLKNYGVDDSNGTNRHEYWVKTNWSLQTDGAPTWAARYINYNRDSTGATTAAWQTAGATGSNEIDSSTHVDLALTGASGTGYKTIDLTASWIDGWQGDTYSSGLLLKDSTDTGGSNDRHVIVTAQGQANTPVMEITYSAVDDNQLAARKLTSDTFSASTFSTQNRYCQIPSTDQFAVMAQVNAELKIDVFYIEPGGRIGRACQNAYNSGRSRFGATSPCSGLHYDYQTGRYWLGGNSETGNYLQLGYSAPYVPTAFTWVENTSVNSVKSSFFPRNDIVYVVHGNYTAFASQFELRYRTYNRGTATWGGNTQLLDAAPVTTTLSATITSGSTTISCGSTASFPSFGALIIDSEVIWYTGKTAGSFTGCTRGMAGTTAASHTSSATIYEDRTSPTYLAMSYDSVNDRMCVSYQIVSADLYAYIGLPDLSATGGALMYNRVGVMFYDFVDARWENGAGSALSLPLTATTEEPISRSDGPAYNLNLTALDDGSVLAGVGEAAAPIGTSTDSTTSAFWTEGRANRLASGTWTAIDAPDLMETKYTDTFGGRIVVTGIGPLVQSDGTETVYRADSSDYGVTYGTQRAISTHGFAAPSNNTNWKNNVLWCSGASEQGNLASKGIAYYQHFAYHGALFLDAIQYPQVTTYTVDAIVDPTRVLTSYTADALVSAVQLTSYTVDAIVATATATQRTTTYTVDAVVKATSTRSYTVDAIVNSGSPAPGDSYIATPTSLSSRQSGNSSLSSQQSGNSYLVPADQHHVS